VDIEPLLKQSRPGWALLILAAPVALFVVVVVLYTGMISLGLQGREALGPPLVLTVETCEAAAPVLKARLADIGLPGEVVADGPGRYTLSTSLTGREDVDAALPEALLQPGHFALTFEGATLLENDGVLEAIYRLDGMMDMWLLLRLNDVATEAVVAAVRSSKPGDRLEFVLDGTPVAMQPTHRSVQRGEVEGIPLAEIDQKTRMRLIAEWSMQIDHPLPCEARAVGR
jgi:hypothetical protein